MKELALQERFEEAAEIRNRLGSLINGISRGIRIRSLTRIEELITAIPDHERVEFAVIRHGKLAGTAIAERGFERATLDSLKRSAEVVIPQPGILPASSHEEVERLLRYLTNPKIRLVEMKGEWSMPAFSAAAYRDELSLVRERGDKLRYKELFANSVERSAQRSSN